MSALSTLAAEPLLPQFDATKPEVMVSAALYLMSSYGCGGGCPKLAHVILKHLRILAEREDLAPVLRNTAPAWSSSGRSPCTKCCPPPGSAAPARAFSASSAIRTKSRL